LLHNILLKRQPIPYTVGISQETKEKDSERGQALSFATCVGWRGQESFDRNLSESLLLLSLPHSAVGS
jgi:hypothetical protein